MSDIEANLQEVVDWASQHLLGLAAGGVVLLLFFLLLVSVDGMGKRPAASYREDEHDGERGDDPPSRD